MGQPLDKTREFAPLAERHRRFSRMASMLSVPFLVWLALWFAHLVWEVLPIDAEPWFYIIGVVIFCPNAFVWLSRPGLACPACKGNLEQVGAYCPECGSASLETRTAFSSPACGACGKTLSNHESGRSYRIRNCTHCGCLLDAEGI